MKVILLNEVDRFFYPVGIKSLEQFMEYIENNKDRFIPMDMLLCENCVHPFYIGEDVKTFYINFMEVSSITEEEVTVLPKSEYDKRLEKVINDVCIYCENYEEDTKEDNLKGHRDKMCLDGKCWAFCKLDDDEDE